MVGATLDSGKEEALTLDMVEGVEKVRVGREGGEEEEEKKKREERIGDDGRAGLPPPFPFFL